MSCHQHRVDVHCVAQREAEHHRVVALHAPPSRETGVRRGEPAGVARSQAPRKGVVNERYGHGGLGQLGPVRRLSTMR